MHVKVLRTLCTYAALILGCDRGFGRAIAKKLDEEGFAVIAGCLEDSSLATLKQESSERLQPVKLDVTNTEDLKIAYKWLAENMEGKGKIS